MHVLIKVIGPVIILVKYLIVKIVFRIWLSQLKEKNVALRIFPYFYSVFHIVLFTFKRNLYWAVSI